MATITVIQPSIMTETVKRRVAAYCRVSSSSEDQLNSYQAQLTYYSHKFEDSTTEEEKNRVQSNDSHVQTEKD